MSANNLNRNIGSNSMTKLQDHIDDEQWNKVFGLISNDNSLYKHIEPYDVAWKLFYYSLVANKKEEQISPFVDFEILKQVATLCKKNGIQGQTIPQATAFQDKERIISLLQSGHKIDEEDFGDRTAIVVAATLNDYDLTSFLIEQNCNVSHSGQDNFEAIDFTTSDEIIELLHLHNGKTKEERKKEFDEYCEAKEYWNAINKK